MDLLEPVFFSNDSAGQPIGLGKKSLLYYRFYSAITEKQDCPHYSIEYYWLLSSIEKRHYEKMLIEYIRKDNFFLQILETSSLISRNKHTLELFFNKREVNKILKLRGSNFSFEEYELKTELNLAEPLKTYILLAVSNQKSCLLWNIAFCKSIAHKIKLTLRKPFS